MTRKEWTDLLNYDLRLQSEYACADKVRRAEIRQIRQETTRKIRLYGHRKPTEDRP